MLHYQLEPKLKAEEYIELLSDNALGSRRPIDDPERVELMLRQANIIVTAREGDRLVGLARSLSDMVYVTYLSDLAVRNGFQKRGIGKKLMLETYLAAPQAKIVLLAAPSAETYYPSLGLERHPHCFIISDLATLL